MNFLSSYVERIKTQKREGECVPTPVARKKNTDVSLFLLTSHIPITSTAGDAKGRGYRWQCVVMTDVRA